MSLKVVQYKQQSRLEEKRKKALDLQLDFIVGQTEKYSDLLSKSLAPTRPAETVPPTPPKALPPPVDEDGEKCFIYIYISRAYCLSMRPAYRAESQRDVVIVTHQ